MLFFNPHVMRFRESLAMHIFDSMISSARSSMFAMLFVVVRCWLCFNWQLKLHVSTSKSNCIVNGFAV